MSGAFDPSPLRPDVPAYGCGSMSIQQGGEVLTVPGLTGLTARQHAAIVLRVPDSGSEWLDAMIRTSLRNDFAAQAMCRIVAADQEGIMGPDITAGAAFNLARSMIAQMEKK